MTDFGGITEPRTTFIGRSQTPEDTGTSSGGGTYVLRVPLPTDAVLTRVEIYGGSANGTVKIRRFARTPASGGNSDFNKVGEDYSVPVVAETLTSVDVVDFTAGAGEYIAIVPTANSVRVTSTSVDSQGFFWNGSDVTSFVLPAGNTGSDGRFEVRLYFETLAIKQVILDIADFPPATGYEEIARSYRINGDPRVQIGFQDVDDQDPQAGFLRVFCGEANVAPANNGLAAGSTFFDFTTYQYGGAWKGWGAHGETVEFQLACDADLDKSPELSVRHRVGGVNRGSRIQTRNGLDTVGFGLNFQSDADPYLWLEDNEDTPLTLGIAHPKPEGAIVSRIGGNQIHRVGVAGLLTTVAAADGDDITAHEFVFGADSRLRLGQGGSASTDPGSGYVEIANGSGERMLRIANLAQPGAGGSLFSATGIGSNHCYFLFGSAGEGPSQFSFASNGSALGTALEARNGDGSNAVRLDYVDPTFPFVGLASDTPSSLFGIWNPHETGAIVSRIGAADVHRIGASGLLTTLAAADVADAVAHEFVFGPDSRLRLGQSGSASTDPGSGYVEITNGAGDRTLRISNLSQPGASGSLVSGEGAGSNRCYFLFGGAGDDGTLFTFGSNGSGLGAALSVTNEDGSDAVRLDYSDPAFPFVGLASDAPSPLFGIWNPHEEGAVVIRSGVSDVVTFPAAGGLNIRKSAAEPADPAEGNMALWLSDGEGAGDEGDVMVKITIGGVTKTATLVDFSVL